jgi:replicative DNA helicase
LLCEIWSAVDDLNEICEASPAVAHVERHAEIVRKKWRERQLIATCQTIAAEGYGDHSESKPWIAPRPASHRYSGERPKIYGISARESAAFISNTDRVLALEVCIAWISAL